jgi:hypothetical protein
LKRKYTRLRTSNGRSGSGSNDVEKWPFFDVLNGFLKDINSPRKTLSNFDDEESIFDLAEESQQTTGIFKCSKLGQIVTLFCI